jgi:hypothetical protein
VGRQRDGAQQCDVSPGEVAVGAGELVELCLLADPEDSICHPAHQEDEKARPERDQGIAECGPARAILSGNAVVEGVHRKEFSG